MRSAARIAREQRRKVEEEAGELRGGAGARGGGFRGAGRLGAVGQARASVAKPGLEGCTCVRSCCASLKRIRPCHAYTARPPQYIGRYGACMGVRVGWQLGCVCCTQATLALPLVCMPCIASCYGVCVADACLLCCSFFVPREVAHLHVCWRSSVHRIDYDSDHVNSVGELGADGDLDAMLNMLGGGMRLLESV